MKILNGHYLMGNKEVKNNSKPQILSYHQIKHKILFERLKQDLLLSLIVILK